MIDDEFPIGLLVCAVIMVFLLVGLAL